MDEYFEILKNYNSWSDTKPETVYIRSEYTDKIYSYSGKNRLIKVLVGQRRVGKSYILRQLAMKLIESDVDSKNILFINRELSEFNCIQKDKDLDALVKLHRKE